MVNSNRGRIYTALHTVCAIFSRRPIEVENRQ